MTPSSHSADAQHSCCRVAGSRVLHHARSSNLASESPRRLRGSFASQTVFVLVGVQGHNRTNPGSRTRSGGTSRLGFRSLPGGPAAEIRMVAFPCRRTCIASRGNCKALRTALQAITGLPSNTPTGSWLAVDLNWSSGRTDEHCASFLQRIEDVNINCVCCCQATHPEQTAAVGTLFRDGMKRELMLGPIGVSIAYGVGVETIGLARDGSCRRSGLCLCGLLLFIYPSTGRGFDSRCSHRD